MRIRTSQFTLDSISMKVHPYSKSEANDEDEKFRHGARNYQRKSDRMRKSCKEKSRGSHRIHPNAPVATTWPVCDSLRSQFLLLSLPGHEQQQEHFRFFRHGLLGCSEAPSPWAHNKKPSQTLSHAWQYAGFASTSLTL